MEQFPKVIGRIELPDAPKKHKCVCDECGNDVNDTWGDMRTKVTRKYADGKEEIRYVCPDCDFELFGNLDNEPRSIFDGTPDWMRMCY